MIDLEQIHLYNFLAVKLKDCCSNKIFGPNATVPQKLKIGIWKGNWDILGLFHGLRPIINHSINKPMLLIEVAFEGSPTAFITARHLVPST
jgi:hypothetical protein